MMMELERAFDADDYIIFVKMQKVIQRCLACAERCILLHHSAKKPAKNSKEGRQKGPNFFYSHTS